MSLTSPSWDQLTEAWHDDDAPAVDVERVARTLRSRRLKMLLVVALEGLVTLGMLRLTWVWTRTPTVLPGAWALLGLWGVWLAATTFAWWNRRGQWVVDVASLEAFTRLSRQRAERKVRVAWFSVALTAVQMALLMAIASNVRVSPAVVVAAVVSGLGVIAWAWWYYRGAVRERSYFGQVLEELDEEATRRAPPA